MNENNARLLIGGFRAIAMIVIGFILGYIVLGLGFFSPYLMASSEIGFKAFSSNLLPPIIITILASITIGLVTLLAIKKDIGINSYRADLFYHGITAVAFIIAAFNFGYYLVGMGMNSWYIMAASEAGFKMVPSNFVPPVVITVVGATILSLVTLLAIIWYNKLDENKTKVLTRAIFGAGMMISAFVIGYLVLDIGFLSVTPYQMAASEAGFKLFPSNLLPPIIIMVVVLSSLGGLALTAVLVRINDNKTELLTGGLNLTSYFGTLFTAGYVGLSTFPYTAPYLMASSELGFRLFLGSLMPVVVIIIVAVSCVWAGISIAILLDKGLTKTKPNIVRGGMKATVLVVAFYSLSIIVLGLVGYSFSMALATQGLSIYISNVMPVLVVTIMVLVGIWVISGIAMLLDKEN